MKKLIAALCAIMMMNTAICTAEGIYTYDTVTEMPGGARLRNIRRFYGDYSLNINCVEADLKNEHISLELLKNGNGCDKVDTVLNLAGTREDVVAAVNADFFSHYSGTQNFSLGLEIQDGKLLQSHIDTEKMAAGIYSGNTLDLSYISFSAAVTAENGASMAVTHINKPTKYFGALLMYTADFNGGTSPYLPAGITVITVTDKTVTGKGTSMGGTVTIPENGYILAIDDSMTPFLEYNMNIGEAVKLDVSASPSISDVQTAFGGGTMLLSDGKKTKITHNISGINPRTAIGTNADGTVVYLITVDGRQQVSRGVTLDKLADICLELGCVNAINLDGGGSTQMVGKTFENQTVHTLNYPSENRKVINGVAVVSDAAPGEAAGFKVSADSYNLLKGDFTKLYAYAYDTNYNPPANNDYKLDWVISKGSGKIEDNVFYAESGGETVVDLYCNNVWQASCVFNVIDDVYGITAEKVYYLNPGESIPQTIASVYDKEGNSAPVNDISLLSPACDVTFLSFDNNRITPLREGAGELVLSHDGVERSVMIVCGSGKYEQREAVTRDPLMSSSKGSYVFNVFAGAPVQTLFGRINYASAVKKMSEGAASAMLGGNVISNITPSGVSPITADSYSETRLNGGLVLSLVINNEGSLSSGGQWEKLTAAINTAAEKNIFILLKTEPWLSYELEADVFRDYLSDAAKNKNVFVIYNGDENLSVIQGGVRYISLADAEDYPNMKDAVNKMKYVSFSVSPEGVTYSFENLYNNSSDGNVAAYEVY